MALIGSIRKNGWILIVMMTLALGGFILMEIISNAQRNSAGDVNTLGKVNGEEIKRADFENYQKLIYTNAQANPFQVRTQTWNYFVENALVSQEAEKIGLAVPHEELMDLQFGNSISPVIAERFKGEDGQVNRVTLSSVKAAIEGGQFDDPVNRAYWAVQEKEVVKQRLQDKLTSLVTKGFYTPSWQAEMVFKENNEHLNFTYVRIPYDKVQDSELQLSDADYQAYLKDNPHLYDQQEETRTLGYVAIDVNPTGADSTTAREAVNKLVEGLRTAPSDSLFALSHDGTFDDTYKKKADLPPAIADTLLKLPTGSIVGPYLDGGIWNIAKIVDRKVIPDSVSARHILVKDPTPASEKRLDSLRALIDKGMRFDSVAIHNSADRGSAIKGGELGYMAAGRTVPEFNAVLFYTGEKGKLYKVKTQFGWHLIEILDKKFIKNEAGVKAVYLSQRIEPGKATQQAAKDRAIALVQKANSLEELNTLAGQEGLQVQTSAPLKANDFTLGQLGAGEDARDVVRWAFDKKTKVGNISKEVFSFGDEQGGYFDSKYVIAGLKGIAPKGEATVATLKAIQRAENEVKNRKRAEIIKGKIQNASDLNALAQQWSVQVDTAQGASMLQVTLKNGGSEPRVIGTAFGLNAGSVSKPIAGNTGVYVVQPLGEKMQQQAPADLTLFKRQVTSSAVSAIRMGLLNTMKKTADLRDNRSRFF